MSENLCPKRILHVVSAMNRGGAETLIMNIYRNIDRSKIQFDFISHSNQKCDYEDEIKRLGGRVIHIQSLGQSGLQKYVSNIKKIIGLNGPYIAVHAHTDFQSGIVAMAAKQAGIKKRICHSHNNDWTMGPGFKAKITLNVLKSMISRFGTDFCACSYDAAQFLFTQKLVEAGKVYILKNGIEVSEFQNLNNESKSNILRELNIPAGKKLVGHIGRFYEQKNHFFILKILKNLKEDSNDFIAIFVGDGPLKEAVELEAQRLGIMDHIRFLGVREDIPQLMRAFDIFVFPSLFEGFGIVMIEAQAAGTPCVASLNVPKETDMELGIVSYVSLNEGSESWAYEVNRALSLKRPDRHTATSAISKKGFDIKLNISDWLGLYGV